jgi:hypothetical protein
VAQEELRAIAQIYRDRGDAEDMLDELVNQWGWTGFSTAGLKRNQLMARMANGSRHGDAVTTRRPLFQHGVDAANAAC